VQRIATCPLVIDPVTLVDDHVSFQGDDLRFRAKKLANLHEELCGTPDLDSIVYLRNNPRGYDQAQQIAATMLCANMPAAAVAEGNVTPSQDCVG
jgi:hypothetical protein